MCMVALLISTLIVILPPVKAKAVRVFFGRT